MSSAGSRYAITPQRVGAVVWRRKLVCLMVAGIVFLGGAGLLLSRPKVYRSTASVALLPLSTNSAILPNYPNLITSLIPTYIELVDSPLVLGQVAASLPFRMSAAHLANVVHAESLSNAAVINIVAESQNPVQAQEIASLTTAVFLAQIQGNGVVVAQVYGQPVVPGKPAGPPTKLVLAVILILAIMLGLGAGLVWDRLSLRVAGAGPPDVAGAGNLEEQPRVTPAPDQPAQA